MGLNVTFGYEIMCAPTERDQERERDEEPLKVELRISPCIRGDPVFYPLLPNTPTESRKREKEREAFCTFPAYLYSLAQDIVG
jgi:hypothetical protein